MDIAAVRRSQATQAMNVPDLAEKVNNYSGRGQDGAMPGMASGMTGAA